MRLGSLVIGIALSSLGCAGAARSVPVRGVVAPAVDHFDDDEARVLRSLASVDPRFAARAKIQTSDAELGKAAMGAILSEDATAGAEAGRVDVFSFDTRARALDEADRLVRPYAMAKPPAHAREAERLVRLVAAERARLAFERELPRGAPTLLEGLMWTATTVPAEAEKNDAWLARRLGEVKASLASRPISAELRDAIELSLDGVERKITSAYDKTTRALVDLRVALTEVAIDPDVHPNPRAFDALGVTDPAAVEARLRALRDKLDPIIEARHREEKDQGIHAEPTKFDGEGASCAFGADGASRLGAMTVDRDRATVCSVVTTFAPLHKMRLSSFTLAALSYLVTVGLRSMEIARGQKPDVYVPHAWATDSVKRYLHAMQLPELRPVEALGTALAVEWLLAGVEVDDITSRAAKWDAYGDAPIDLALRDLGP